MYAHVCERVRVHMCACVRVSLCVHVRVCAYTCLSLMFKGLSSRTFQLYR